VPEKHADLNELTLDTKWRGAFFSASLATALSKEGQSTPPPRPRSR